MTTIKRILVIVLLISIILSLAIILSFSLKPSKSKNTKNPTLSIGYASGYRISPSLVQQSYLGNLTGNITFKVTADLIFNATTGTTFTGVFHVGCGIGVSLVNTPDWYVVPLTYFCPAIGYNESISAGTYHNSIFFYLNTMKNYTTSNYPKNIGFYAYSTLNYLQLNTSVYSFKLVG